MTDGDSNAARVTELKQGGIAPTPSFLFPGGESSFIPPVMGFDLFRELQQTLGLILFHFYTCQNRGKIVV